MFHVKQFSKQALQPLLQHLATAASAEGEIVRGRTEITPCLGFDDESESGTRRSIDYLKSDLSREPWRIADTDVFREDEARV